MSKSLRDRVAEHFRAHPDEWVDSQLLAKLAGHGGWRTRKNECERQLGMKILNRQYRRNGYTVSEYKFVTQESLFEGAA